MTPVTTPPATPSTRSTTSTASAESSVPHDDSAASSTLPGRPLGLGDLADLPLSVVNQRTLDRCAEDIVAGSAAWRERKLAEARDLLALSQIAPRLQVRHLDLRTELLALVELRDMPVPTWAPDSPELKIEHGTLLAIHYPEDLLIRPIPGTVPIRILEPRFVYHSNVGPFGSRAPSLCLGANVPRGFPLREMVLASYAALTLQAISLDNMDPAGVLHAKAAVWWQANSKRIPLTSEPFLGWRPVAGDTPAAANAEGRP